MMRKQEILVAVILLVSVNMSLVYSEQRFGVKTGDWIKLSVTVWNAPSGTPSPVWMKIEFISVEGTTATVRMTMHMSDGAEQNQTSVFNLETGSSTGGTTGLTGLAIPVNMSVGDDVYLSSYGNITIIGETVRSYAGASRNVLYANVSSYGTQTYYWDKQTGIITEITSTAGGVTSSGKVTETNMWGPQFLGLPVDATMFFLFVAVAAAVVLVLVALLVLRKKRPKPSEQVAPPIPPPPPPTMDNPAVQSACSQ